MSLFSLASQGFFGGLLAPIGNNYHARLPPSRARYYLQAYPHSVHFLPRTFRTFNSLRSLSHRLLRTTFTCPRCASPSARFHIYTAAFSAYSRHFLVSPQSFLYLFAFCFLLFAFSLFAFRFLLFAFCFFAVSAASYELLPGSCLSPVSLQHQIHRLTLRVSFPPSLLPVPFGNQHQFYHRWTGTIIFFSNST